MTQAQLTTPPATTPGAPSWTSVLRLLAHDIKLAHSVFAMPFALLGAFLAASAPPSPPAGGDAITREGIAFDARTLILMLVLVVACMVLARTWAMLVNRLADRGFDAENQRTKRRVFAAGTVQARTGWRVALACAGLFIAATSVFWLAWSNPWPLMLSLPVLGWIALYSYTKRFTALCHLVLGSALAFSPIAAALALRPEAVIDTPSILAIAGMVMAWVAGFDIIYALQDEAFDRERGLHSIPAWVGWKKAAWISRGLHIIAAASLVLAWRIEPRFGVVFGAAVMLTCGLLVLEHVVLARKGQAGLDMAFFTLNGIVSCVLGLAGIVDLTVV